MKNHYMERMRTTLQPSLLYELPPSPFSIREQSQIQAKKIPRKYESKPEFSEKQNISFKNKQQLPNFYSKKYHTNSTTSLAFSDVCNKYTTPNQTPIKQSQFKKVSTSKRKVLNTCCKSAIVANHTATQQLAPFPTPETNKFHHKSRKTLQFRPKTKTPSFLKKIIQNKMKKQWKINDFFMIKKLGIGRYGNVTLAMEKATGFMCAIKTLNKSMIRDEDISSTLIQQIKIQMYLHHPNIVKSYGCFDDHQNIYLMLQYCPDGNLETLIKKTDEFTEENLLPIITNVFQAVFCLHCEGIIHRDIKPQNIVISNGTYKVCDFGWAAYASGKSRSTFCGTPLYVSPQVLTGNGYNQKTDIWGLGVLCYELIFGTVPFKLNSPHDMMKIMKDEIRFPEFDQDISLELVEMVKKMLRRNCEERLSINEILDHPIINKFMTQQKQELSLTL